MIDKNSHILIILDGFGIRKSKVKNAVKIAKMPFYNSLLKKYPNTKLNASGIAVGLPDNSYMGNSEVGHLHIGAGRIVKENLTRISESIKNKSFFKNKILLKAMKTKTLHLIGLLSDAGVHSHIAHLFALIKMAKKQKVKNIYIHIITDGRDTPPKSALKYINKLITKFPKTQIATLSGRYYTMDRDKRWKRTKLAYNALFGISKYKAKSAKDAIKQAYKRNETDEFIKPTIINNFQGIKNNETIIFYNFRSDRAKQLTAAFTDKKFNKFKTNKAKTHFVCMTQYHNKLKTPIIFKPEILKNTLGDVISKNNLKQIRIAETEKKAHVTFFFNGQSDKKFKNEERCIFPSPKSVPTYDLAPLMSAKKIKSKVIQVLKKKKHNFILVNFANPDMVGHTADIKATVKALEYLDSCLKEIIQTAQKTNTTTYITADHGNCEHMVGKYKTSHTTNKVPFIIIQNPKLKTQNSKLKQGGLSNIAPTILKSMKIKIPKQMTSKPLIS